MSSPGHIPVSSARSLPQGSEFTALLILRRSQQKRARNDAPFLQLELGDASGAFSATIFSDNPAFEAAASLAEGSAIEIRARVDAYNSRFAPRLLELRALSDDELQGLPLDSLVEVPPEPAPALRAEIESTVATLQPDELRATVAGVLDDLGDRFWTAPAATGMHHAYRHGLLEHTTRMVRAARALLPLYPEVPADLALAGIILHDAGKALEFEPGLSPRRGRTGQLNGHVVLGYRLARQHGLRQRLPPELLERLEHIILSHQGEPEWGAAIYAATPEAVFVSLVDNLDAKMGMVQRTLRHAPRSPNPTDFSDYLPGLNSPLLLPPPPAPSVQSAVEPPPPHPKKPN